MNSSTSQRTTLVTAMICAAAVTAQFVGGKATRDALYLAQLDVTSLPLMVVATSLVSIALVMLASRYMQSTSPAFFVPLAFTISAVMLLVEWGLTYTAPRVGAAAVYLQISGIGPMLGSGFWLILSEAFDPRTAKRRFGQIAGVGTLGGLLGGVFAERIAVMVGISAMLPALAIMNLFCAWQIARLARQALPLSFTPHVTPADDQLPPSSVRPGLRVLRDAPYLQNLAALVLLGTAGATLVDYVFKVQAVAAFGRGDALLRFFAIYYAAISLLTFAIQTSSSRVALEKLGLAVTAGTPSLALIFTGIGSLFAPGLQSVALARGGESVFRGSLFRSGYELFYTPIPLAEKSAAKSIIDVGFDRLGDAVGGGIIRVLIVTLSPVWQGTGILIGAILCSVAALAIATRLNRGYIQTLERSLLNRAVELELGDVHDVTTRTVMFNTVLLGGPNMFQRSPSRATRRFTAPEPAAGAPVPADAEVLKIAALRSRDAPRVLATLRELVTVPAYLVQHVIPLLAWDAVAQEAMIALRKVAEERIGELTDALLDPNQPFVIRRRIARVFSVCSTQRAADGLLLALDDMRFEVRFHCARSLTSIRARNANIRIDRERIFEVVQREAAVGRPVWDSKRLLPQFDDAGPNMFVDDFVKDRANRSLVHVFTLLALVLPAEPLQIAFRGLHTDDQNLRGTALEYLEGVLPAPIRERLWPYLEDNRQKTVVSRPREQILQDLLRSHQSIMLNLEELKQRPIARS